jgi:hypothetical protein
LKLSGYCAANPQEDVISAAEALFALGAAKVPALAIFDNTEFLLLTLINLAQTAVAYQINSATLMRTISPVS